MYKRPGIPVPHRDVNQSVTFVTGHDQSGATPQSLNWKAIAEGAQVLVIYMGMKHVEQIATALLDAGRPTDEPVAVVFNATTPNQQVLETTLCQMVADIHSAGVDPPAALCARR